MIPGANEIVPGLFVGDWKSAVEYDKPRRTICVLEASVLEGRRVEGSAWHPILDPMRAGRATRRLLDDAAWAIEKLMAIERDPDFVAEPPLNPVLVHCAAGQERSPLTVVWWLVRSGRAKDVDEAYAIVINGRAIAQRREAWLEELP